MKTLKNLSFYLLLLVTLVGMTSCEEDEEYIEDHLGGTWFTNQEIDFGAQVQGYGTYLFFDYNTHRGYIGTDDKYETYDFTWHWYDGYSNTIELIFAGDGSTAYISDIYCNNYRLSGVWYNNYQDWKYEKYGQPFSMSRY